KIFKKDVSGHVVIIDKMLHYLPNVIGELDGSHMNLFEAPSKSNKEVYFARKRRYAIHLQAVVDNQFMMPKYSEISLQESAF
ncbi:12148_t:CDS:1, partial [Gigaspora rosea]